MLGKKWSFLLNYSLHAKVFEVMMSCLRGERLVGDVLKGLDDLDSIVNLSRCDKTLSIANIGGGKLKRVTTRGL